MHGVPISANHLLHKFQRINLASPIQIQPEEHSLRAGRQRGLITTYHPSNEDCPPWASVNFAAPERLPHLTTYSKINWQIRFDQVHGVPSFALSAGAITAADGRYCIKKRF
jgi:hypothetical protein